MRPELRNLLLKEAEKFELKLQEDELKQFQKYLKLIQEYNQKINLTAIKDEQGIVVKHFLDSLAGALFLKKGWFVADFGSGMGCPGLALKIARKDLRMILLESKQKKVAFLNLVIRQLGLKNIQAIAQRIDHRVFQNVLAGQIDAVLARAFGRLGQLFSLSAPYLKKGGILIAYKGPKWKEELEKTEKEQRKFSFKLVDSYHYQFPFQMGERFLLVFKKS